MTKILHNPRCRKSRNTLKILEEKGESIEIVEYLKNPPTRDELE
ncbi:MAG: arsenate reductase (glutaredoxin), partial [Cyclobacteriaceae bacterium]|nr:arsenate reductase (glutaredoxin) [Cyclobacteriaceae bacterium]